MEITTNSSVHDSAYEDAVDRDLFPEVSGEEGSLKQMQTLVSKLWNGQALGTSDQEFLVASSKATASWGDRLVSYFATPPDETSVVAIHRLGEQVLAGSLSNREALRNIGAMIAAKSDLSQRELAALSQLIMSCQRREPDLSALASRMAAKPLFRDELIPMIDQYNHEALSKRGNAGEVVARVMLNADQWGSAREAIVQYNRLGFLELVDGAATPMDLTARQTLTTHQVEQLKSIYGEVNEGFHYNNLAIVLEFAHHYRQAHTRDPDRSTEEIYQSFRPELVALDRKYHSGTCGVLASKFLHESSERLGIVGQSISHFTENNWTVIPFPGSENSPIKWNQLSNQVHGFDHTDAVVIYRDEEGQDRVLKFACSLEKDNPDEITQFKSVNRKSIVDSFLLLQNSSVEDRPNRATDDGQIAKAFLKGRYKAVMTKDGGKLTLGIDFLRENFYINKSWSDTIRGIPKNEKGMASIDLKDLATPDAVGVYFIDGERVEISHREALRMILKKAEGEFHIPRDMEEGLIGLAQMAPVIARDLFIQPLPFIKEHYASLQRIGKRIKELTPDITSKEYDHDKVKILQALNKRYDEMLDHLINEYNPDAARDVMNAILKEFCQD